MHCAIAKLAVECVGRIFTKLSNTNYITYINITSKRPGNIEEGPSRAIMRGFVTSFKDRSNAIEKIIISLSLLFLILVIIIIFKTPHTSGYEISIYDIYPKYFWFLILFSILGGQFVLVKNSIYSNYHNFSIVFGTAIIILADFILISIPIVRDYALFGREDVLSHIGFVLDILNSGFIGFNSYPIVHILSAQLTLITGMHKYMPSQLIPAIFSLLHLLFFYILAKFVSRDQGELSLTLAFAFILVFSISISQIVSYSVFAPYSQLILMFPLVIYIYLKSILPQYNYNYNFKLLMIILIFGCVFIHPLSGIAMMTMFLAWTFIKYTPNYNKYNIVYNYNLQSSKIYTLLYIIAFSMWGGYIYFFIKSIIRVNNSILGIDKTSELNHYIDITNRLSPDLYDLFTVFITSYGQAAIIVLLLFVSLYYIFFKKKIGYNYIFLALPISICGLILLCISFILIFISSLFPFGRFFAWALLFSPFIIAHAIYTYLTKIRNQGSLHGLKNFVIIVTLCFILFLISYFSLFNLYASPINFSFNQQVAASELSGMEWFFNFISLDLPIIELGINQLRFNHAIYGFNSKNGILKEKSDRKSDSVQNHFGYDKSSRINHTDAYLIINYIGKNFYQEVYGKRYGDKYKDKWKFYPADFIKLGLDSSVNRIYSNGNLDAYKIS